jgi:regulator of sirC expression with transglutaminase-like and TPR domain
MGAKKVGSAEHVENVREEFSRLASLSDDRINLARAGLLISRIEYPNLNESDYLDRLDNMSERLGPRIAASSDRYELIEALNHVLFMEEGFRGNLENYYDLRNSFLSQVLDRKLGIPITLSLVYMEVGRRAGLEIHGIGLPGHFIVALSHGNEKIFIDPFNRGKTLSEEECRHRVAARSGEGGGFETRLLDPVAPKAILVRILRNLKNIYRQMNKELKKFQMIEWILALNPHATRELLERGSLYETMGAFDLAVRDLERYLELSPAAQDRETIKAKVEILRTETPRIH